MGEVNPNKFEPQNNQNYGSWLLIQLRSECQRRKIKSSGSKAQLVKRLRDFDSVSTTNLVVAQDNGYKFPFQDPLHYRELNASQNVRFPKTLLNDYLQSLSIKMDATNGENMYKEGYLVSNLRYCVDQNGNVFVKGRVRSSHSKSIIYNIDVKFSIVDNMITDIVCECKAGLGPSARCKHVIVVLKSMEDFGNTGAVIYEKVCTETLQKFHQAKKFKFSPIKARTLQLTRPLKSIKKIVDPRPEDLIPSKEKFCHNTVLAKQGRLISKANGDNHWCLQQKFSRFRNLCLNFAAEFSQVFPELQLFESANILALSLDHDYCKDNMCQLFLKAAGISEINKDQIDAFEFLTRAQSQSKYWLHDRGMRLNSSSWGKIIRICCQYSDVNNNLSDAEIKEAKGQEKIEKNKLAQEILHPKDLSHVPAIQHGRKYEIHAIRRFETLSQKKTQPCGSIISLQKPFLAASPDRLLLDKFCVEIKSPYSAFNKIISQKTVPYLKKDEKGRLTLDLDHPQGFDYFAQCQGQLFCSNREICFLVIYTVLDCYIIQIEREEIFLENAIKILEDYFQEYYLHLMLKKYFYKN